MDANDFTAQVPLYDLTIAELPAGGGTIEGPVTGAEGSAGSGTYLYVTNKVLPQNTSQLPSGIVADALYVQVTPCIVSDDSTGVLSYPDLNWWFTVDGNNDLQKFMNFDGSYATNMLPNKSQTRGEKFVVLGQSLRRLLKGVQAGKGRRNIPMLATGVKYVSELHIKARSTAGFPGAGKTVIQPGRIRVWGERYNQNQLDQFASVYPTVNSFARNDMRRQIEGLAPVAGVQSGIVSQANWISLPGGYGQSGAIVNRYFNYAQNLLATTANTAYALTNSQQAGGNKGQVGLQNDLGFPFGATNGNSAQVSDAVILQEFGVASGIANIGFVGLDFGGTLVPEGQGWPIDSVVNDLVYGQTSESGVWYALGGLPGDIVLAGENAAVFIQDNGTPVAANAATVAVGGVRVTL